MPNATSAQRNAPRAPKLLDRVRETMRTNRYSPRTEAAYVAEKRRSFAKKELFQPQVAVLASWRKKLRLG
jgi:hypothetical protein